MYSLTFRMRIITVLLYKCNCTIHEKNKRIYFEKVMTKSYNIESIKSITDEQIFRGVTKIHN